MKRYVVETISQIWQSRRFAAMVCICAAAILSQTGCSAGSSSSQTSAVSIQLPNVSHLRASSVGATSYNYDRLMINISGPSSATPAVYIYQANQTGSAAGTAPTNDTVTLSVPQGKGYLVQVLAILQSTSGSNSSGKGSGPFYYGEVTQDFTSSTVPVSVSLAQLNSTSTSTPQGSIAGRWIDGSGNGPTGIVNILYEPPSGTQPMIVGQADIYGGWFQWPAFTSMTFDYRLEDNTPLVTGFNLNSTSLLNGKSNARVWIPPHYDTNNCSTSPCTLALDTPAIFQVGFFGPGAGNGMMCFDDSTSSPLFAVYSDTAYTPVPWLGGTANATVNSNAAGIMGGGAALSQNPGLCQSQMSAIYSGASASATVMAISQAILNGNNQPLNFVGPFQASMVPYSSGGGANAQTITATPSGSTINLAWQYMPGTAGGSGVTAVGLFVRDLATAPSNWGGGHQDYSTDSGVNCNHLTDASVLSQPFTAVATIPVQNSGAGAQTYALTGYSTSHIYNGQLQMILCPYSQTKGSYLPGAAVYSPSSASMNQVVNISAATQSILYNNCTPIALTYQVGGTAVVPPANTMVQLVDTSYIPNSFWYDSGCSTNPVSYSSPIYNFNFGSSPANPSLIYYKSNTYSSQPISFTSQLSQNAIGSTASTFNTMVGMNGGSGASQTPNFVGLNDGSQSGCGSVTPCRFFAGQCVPINGYTKYASNAQYGSPSLALSDTNSPAGSFYSDSACSNQITALTFRPSVTVGGSTYGEFIKTFYFQSSLQSGSGTIGVGSATMTYKIDAPYSPPTSMGFMGSTSWYNHMCNPIQIGINSVGREWTSVAAPLTAMISVTSGPMKLSLDSGCSNASSMLTFPIYPPGPGQSYSSAVIYGISNSGTTYFSLGIPALGVGSPSPYIYVQ